MVGVAGRSKGCHTCKKRKVKCGMYIRLYTFLANERIIDIRRI